MSNSIILKSFVLGILMLPSTAGAGLRATATTIKREQEQSEQTPKLRHAVNSNGSKVRKLKLTDDDDIQFYRYEVEHGYLTYENFESALTETQYDDQDDDYVFQEAHTIKDDLMDTEDL